MQIEDRVSRFRSFMRDRISEEMVEWLIEKGFFTAPASTKYHGNYHGGLFEHSLAVAEELVYLTEQLKLSWDDLRSPFIIGMFHDLCKMDSYKKIPSPNIKNGYIFEYNDKTLLNGHGEKSVMLLSQWIQLTEEEILCIRYHMGAYETDDWNHFGRAITKYPNVLYTHTADMIASHIRGI